MFEIRRVELVATDDERAAAAGRVAELLGRNADSPLVATVVAEVLDAINAQRAWDDQDALDDWRDYHEYCTGGDDL